MAVKKGYMVLEVGYEYNDEFYHRTNSAEMFEAPDKVYFDKLKAVEALEKKNLKNLRGLDLCRYGYCLEDIAKKGKHHKLGSLCEDLGFNPEEGDAIPEDITDEQLHKILDCLELEFFKLVEVEVE